MPHADSLFTWLSQVYQPAVASPPREQQFRASREGAPVIRSICIVSLLATFACAHAAPAVSAPPATAREKAQAARATKEFAAAYPLYTEALCEALAEDPGAPDAAELLRVSLELWEALGRPDSPPEPLASCPLPQPLRTLGDGLVASAMANWQRADEVLAAAAEQAAESPPPWRAEVAMRRALVATHIGQSRAAEEHLLTAARATPDSPEVHLFAAHTQLRLGNPVGTVEALRGMLRAAPSPADLGRARILLRQAADAAAPAPSPADLAAAQELMQTLQSDPIDADELPHARLLVSAAPHPRVLTLAGLLALRLGATAQGIDWLERAQAQNPLDPDPPRIVAGHYVAASDAATAVIALHTAAEANPFDAELAAELARQEQKAGDWVGAAKTLEALLVLEPHVARHSEAYAQVQAQLRDRAAPQSQQQGPPKSAPTNSRDGTGEAPTDRSVPRSTPQAPPASQSQAPAGSSAGAATSD